MLVYICEHKNYIQKFSCIVPKLEVTNNVRQYKNVKPNDRLRTVEKNYHQTNLYHVEKCNAYQVAILNKAATSMMIKRFFLFFRYKTSDLPNLQVSDPAEFEFESIF